MSYVAGDTVTLWIPLKDSDGAAITTAINVNFTNTLRHTTPAGVVSTPSVSNWAHVSNGLYSATITPAVEGTYAGIVDYAGPPIQTFPFDVPVSADIVSEITAATITVSDPVASDGNVTLYQSDHYDADEGRSLEWSTTSADTWPTLTSASIAFVAEHASAKGVETLAVAGSVVVGTGDAKQVRVELTPSDTDGALPGSYSYQVIATLSNGHVVTLVAGTMTITRRIAA